MMHETLVKPAFDRRSAENVLCQAFPYNVPMPCRVHVRIKGVSKPDVIEHGASITKDEEKGEFIVKDVTDQAIGWYRAENVEAWWLESEPFDISVVSEKTLERMFIEMSKGAIASGLSQEKLDEIRRIAREVEPEE